ncbi:hypothetical protein [Nitrincola sp. MINF-07-Sa-05]|uniref:hypothetical protein n=1 Tax=Nitrincola salilacus TaxID=3400273 RepID=UPI003917C6D7
MNQLADQQYKYLFKSSPGKILVLEPGRFEVLAVTDEYLHATMTREADIVGKTLFEVFPDDPEDPQADGVRNLSTSLQRARSLKVPDIMGIQCYPIRLPDGTFEERFWSPVNSPVMDDAGEIAFIILHRVEDVTAIVQEDTGAKSPAVADISDSAAVQDILMRAQELRQAFSIVQRHEARMRTSERMLNLDTGNTTRKRAL